MKKVICLILVAAMMLGFMAMLAVETFAATNDTEVEFDDLKNDSSVTTVIDELEFFLPTLTPGETIPGAPIITVNNPNVTWQQRWGNEFGETIPTGTFQEGQQYWMTAVVTVDAGYIFSEDLNISWIGKCYGASHGLNADKTQFTVSFEVECGWEELDQAELTGVPEQIAAGAAPALSVAAVSTSIQVTDARWVDSGKQAVTAFQEGKAYFLEVTVKPTAGYALTKWTDIYSENKWYNDIVLENSQLAKVYFRYSLLKQVDTLKLQLNDPSLGMEINQLDVTVLEGNVIVMPVQVCDVETGMPVEEPELLDKKNYAIWYSFMPMDGYEFNDNFVDVEVEDCDFELQWSHTPESLIFCRYFSTCTPIETVELTVSGVAIGQKIDDATVTADQNANYTLERFDIYGYSNDGYEPADPTRFDQNLEYTLEYNLVPKEGYVFTYDTQVKLNGNEGTIRLEQGGTRGFGWAEYGFQVKEIWLRDLPDYIEPGNAEIPTLRETRNQVRISNVQWVNADKQPVTQFEDGKRYYLAVTLESINGRTFGENEPVVDLHNNNLYTFQKLSDSQAVVYLEYSLLPDAGNLDITINGLAEGKDIADVTATVSGNATVRELIVYKRVYFPEGDYFEHYPLTEGKVEKNTKYHVFVSLEPKEGYRFAGGSEYTVNGKNTYDTCWDDHHLEVNYYFSTCQKITSASLTMDTPTVGKNLPAVKAPSNANYTVQYTWRDITDDYKEVTGKAQKGHKYSLEIRLMANAGYDFTEDTAFTLNGKKADFDVDREGGTYANYYKGYSFLEKITKVELPAMPKSITLGQDLPVNFTVSGKNYTLEAEWSRYNGGNGESCTKADKKDIYALTFNVRAAAGYEFDEASTKVYVGGQLAKTTYLYMYESDLSVTQVYMVGMETVDRIDVTVSQLEAGKTPTITVPQDANYVLVDSAWAQGNQADFDEDLENVDIVEILANGKYTFMGLLLMPKEGYAIGDDVVFYVNGKQVTPSIAQNMFAQVIVYLPMGKLGEVEKLTAPKVTAADGTLTWDAVLNADSYEIYRATSKSGKYTKVATVATTSWQDDALAKTYYYKVKAIYSADSSKNSGYSNVVSVVYKLAEPVIAVTMDEALGKATISWEKVEGVSKYEIWRATSEGGKYTRISTVKSSETAYTDKYASVGTQYFYKVKAVASKSTYNSGYSNILSATSVCAQAKLTVKLDTATGKPVISWAKVDGAADYWLLRREAGSNASYTVISRQTKLTYTDTEAAVGVEYEYILDVIGKEEALDGKTSEPVSIACGLAKPVLKGVITGQGKPQLTWDAVEGAVKYEVYRSTSSSKGYTLLGDAYSTGVDDMSAATGKTYYYKVVAVGENSKSAESSYVKLTGKCAAPMVFVETAQSGKPSLQWGKVEGAKQYTIYRASSETGKYSKLGTTKSLSYEDKKAGAGKTYFYKVVANASKKSYDSIYSDWVSCNVICAAPSVTVKVDTATGKPALSWKKVDLAAGYRILRKLPGEEVFSVIAEQTGVTFLDTTAPIDTLCIYMVQTVGKTEGLDSGFTKELTVTSAIAQPKLNSGVNSNGKPRFDWQLVEGAVKYEIYRSTKSTKGFTLLATVEDGNAYVDNTVAGGKTFYYKVVAVGNVSSSESAVVKLTGKCAAPWISVANGDSGKPVISWAKVDGAKKYTVYRATSLEGKYTKLGTTTKLSYTDSKAKSGSEYYYKVVANGSKSSYDSIYSNVKMAIVVCASPALKVTNNAQGQPVISWSKVSGATQYKIVYQAAPLGTGGYGCEVCEDCEICQYYECEGCTCQGCICTDPDAGKTVVYTTSTSYTFTDVYADMIGWVEVTAIAENELLSSAPAEAAIEGLPATPALTGKVGENNKPVISWEYKGDAILYEVYRSTKSGSGYKLIGEVDLMTDEEAADVQTYEDLTASKGKTYYYKVVAKGWNSESPMSSYVKVKSK